MDEVFGAENFIATVIWQKVYSPKNTARHFSEDHDYVLVYARDAEVWHPTALPKTAEMEARYSNPDNDPRGPWKAGDLSARNYYAQGTYPITCPSGRVIEGPPKGTYWRVSPTKFKEMDSDKRIWWGTDRNNTPAIKRFLSEVKEGRVPQTLWLYKEVGHTQEAKKELVKYTAFTETENVLNSVKPTRLIQRMLQIATRPTEHDIVLDFFAGSAATGHAVLNQNFDDGGNRRFILVQLPEPLPKPESGLNTIFDMGAARLRNVTNEITSAEDGKLVGVKSDDVLPLLGFRKLRLTSSNFKIWDGTEEPSPEDLQEQLQLFADHVLPDRGEQDILYELMLKAGLPFTATIEEKSVANKKVYSIAEGLLAICLANPITQDCLRGIIELEPQRVICLDTAFGGNDQLKTNSVLEMKSHGIEFRTV
jgi:adenine-specific DNA-methyltransferase